MSDPSLKSTRSSCIRLEGRGKLLREALDLVSGAVNADTERWAEAVAQIWSGVHRLVNTTSTEYQAVNHKHIHRIEHGRSNGIDFPGMYPDSSARDVLFLIAFQP